MPFPWECTTCAPVCDPNYHENLQVACLLPPDLGRKWPCHLLTQLINPFLITPSPFGPASSVLPDHYLSTDLVGDHLLFTDITHSRGLLWSQATTVAFGVYTWYTSHAIKKERQLAVFHILASLQTLLSLGWSQRPTVTQTSGVFVRPAYEKARQI